MVGINAPYYTIGYQAIRLVDSLHRNYSLVNEMPTGRWYPSTVTLPDGNVLIVGGAQIVRHLAMSCGAIIFLRYVCSCCLQLSAAVGWNF